MKVTHIRIVQDGDSDDTLYLHTTLPEAYYPWDDTGQCLTMKCIQGTATSYAARNFPNIPITLSRK